LKKGSVERPYRTGNKYRIVLSGQPGGKTIFAAGFLRRNIRELYGLDFTIIRKRPIKHEITDIIIHQEAGSAPRSSSTDVLSREDRAVFDTSWGEEQGYVLISHKEERPILAYAQNDLGCLYAAATILQLFDKKGRSFCFPSLVIRDHPDFRFRGNNWNIWCEIGGWSYDRGDGLRKYEERIKRKLDMSLRYKINLILFDGFGWNREKFPGYSALMKRLNREARKRGIHLVYGGYGSSYGAGPKYNGHIFRNRVAYPDGKEYECIGNPLAGNSRYLGTCLSNAELMKLKQRELTKFVNALQPGALYIHNIDAGTMAQAESRWKLRCPACRRRWPNDAADAENGMAGAFASFYDGLTDAVNAAGSRGYRPEKDCLCILVSPAYSVHYEDDRSWKRLLDYWGAVSRCMKNSGGVKFGFREQFYNHRGREKRIRQMADVLHEKGNGQEICILNWYGADGYYNDYLFVGNPLLNGIFEGAEMVLNGSGTAYQEPLQLLNAEYTWNYRKSPFSQRDMPASYGRFRRMFEGYSSAEIRTAGLFARNGFLDLACEKLYGKEAGGPMSQVYRLRGKNGESPLLYLWNTFFNYVPGRRFSEAWGYVPHGRLMGSWPEDVEVDMVRRRIGWFRNTADLTEEARTKLKLALAQPDLTPAVRGDIEWLSRSASVAAIFLRVMLEYLSVYKEAQTLLKSEKKENLQAFEKSTRRFSHHLTGVTRRLTTDFSFDTLDYLGADVGQWKNILLFFKRELKAMRKTVADGTRSRPEDIPWW